METSQALHPMFQMVWKAALKNVESMPDDGMTFKPEGLETRPFGEIAVHMANACCTFGDNIGKTAWERVIAFPPDQFRTKPRILEAMGRGGERFLAGLSRLTDQEAARSAKMPWGVEMPQGQAAAALVPHMFYHNGQLAIYLRLRGVKPLFLAR